MIGVVVGCVGGSVGRLSHWLVFHQRIGGWLWLIAPDETAGTDLDPGGGGWLGDGLRLDPPPRPDRGGRRGPLIRAWGRVGLGYYGRIRPGAEAARRCRGGHFRIDVRGAAWTPNPGGVGIRPVSALPGGAIMDQATAPCEIGAGVNVPGPAAGIVRLAETTRIIRTPVQAAKTERTRWRGWESDTFGGTWNGADRCQEGRSIPSFIGRSRRRLWAFPRRTSRCKRSVNAGRGHAAAVFADGW